MNEAQKNAIACLANREPLVDPKYDKHPEQAEKRLQGQAKKCWSHHKDFPSWVTAYVTKWAKAKKEATSAGEDIDIS